MIYLLEMRPVDPSTGSPVVLRYGSAGFMTRPSDDPGNAWFEERIADPGNYERFLFGRGRTRGESDVGGGDIQLLNPDGALDFMLVNDLAFDGRPFTLWGLADENAPWSSREVILAGTMEQAEYPARRVSIRIRDRLSLLRETIQTQAYLGTTVSGGRLDAEGNADLKDVKKPLAYGRVLNVPPVTVDQFDNVSQVSANPLSAITAVRDTGVLLTPTQDYPTLAALKAATMLEGRYATCLALGLLRTQSRPSGTLTVDANEGATLADRSAARIVRRMLGAIGQVNEADFAVLHDANPAECGLWTGTGETTILSAAVAVLASIGGYLTVDRFGVFRVGRLALPTGPGEVVLDETNILDRSEGLSRSAPGDEGDGVPARSVTVRWGRAYTVFSETDLRNVNATDPYRAFAIQEWRLGKAESAPNQTLHPKGPELVFDTCLVNEADATTEAARLLAIYGKRRDLFSVAVAADEIPTIDLGDIVTLAPNRFGMSGGIPARVIGQTPTFATNITELELWR